MADFSSRTIQPREWALIAPEFHANEFRNPDNMGYEFMLWLKALRRKVGQPLTVSSDYRSPERNENAGGASKSAHMDIPCNAVDFSGVGMSSARRMTLVRAALDMGCTRLGIYANGSVHVDRGDEGRASGVLWVKV